MACLVDFYFTNHSSNFRKVGSAIAKKHVGVKINLPEFDDAPKNKDVRKHLERSTKTVILGVILFVAYALGPLHVHSISKKEYVSITLDEKKISGSLIFRLHDGVVLKAGSCGFVFVGDQGLVISERESTELSSDDCAIFSES